jgi:histidinol dehydrogenase
MIRILKSSDKAAMDALARTDAARDPGVVRTARRIVQAVRSSGDEALLAFARRFDLLRGPIEVGQDEMRAAADSLPRDLRAAIALAVRNVRRVAGRQVPKSFRVATTGGVIVEQRVTPLTRVGCYVPGGRYPLASSVIMSAVPAREAGVREVIAVCPKPDAAVMAAALESGVTRLFRVGGAHAVAALAYGTETVPAVERITGPGNAFVAAAKAIVAADCAVDFHAGPSEIVVVSDTGRPEWIAADLIAQAEHDPDARAILITTSTRLAAAVGRAVAAALERYPASNPAREALASRGAIVLARTRREAIALVNTLAPEHAVCDDDQTADAIRTAGTIFVGPWSAQAAGDYVTGSNHILPTGGAARSRGGISAADFVKVTSVQRLTREGLRRLGPAAIALATAEGLTAHADSIRIRIGKARR